MNHAARSRPWSPPRSAFAGFRFPAEVIVVAVRWYLRYGLSYREVEENLWVVKPGGQLDLDVVVNYSPPVLLLRVNGLLDRQRSGPWRRPVGSRG